MRGVARLRFQERTVNDSINIGTNFSMREKESSHGKKTHRRRDLVHEGLVLAVAPS
jgi:hypothetical protein